MEGKGCERWIPLHRKVWEEHNGPVPDGYCVSFKDKNPKNCTIENLMLIKRSELVVMSTKNRFSECPEVTEARLALLRISNAEKERKKNG